MSKIDGLRRTLDSEMIMTSSSFNVNTSRSSGEYSETISLTIKEFQSSDEGTYTCTSTNSLGRKDSTIRLYGRHKRTLYLIYYVLLLRIPLLFHAKESWHYSVNYFIYKLKNIPSTGILYILSDRTTIRKGPPND